MTELVARLARQFALSKRISSDRASIEKAMEEFRKQFKKGSAH